MKTGDKIFMTLTSAALLLKKLGVELRSFLHTSVILVALVLSIVPTERFSHTPLSHCQQGSTTVTLMWKTGNVEVLFYVINAVFVLADIRYGPKLTEKVHTSKANSNNRFV